MLKLVAFLAVIAAAAAQTQINYEIPSGQVSLTRGVQKGPVTTPAPAKLAPQQYQSIIVTEAAPHAYPVHIYPADGFNGFDFGFNGGYPGFNGFDFGFNSGYPGLYGFNGLGSNIIFVPQRQRK